MEVVTLEKELNSLAYHGRGIVIGKSADGTKAVIAYFIMGRSENSRNRIFVETILKLLSFIFFVFHKTPKKRLYIIVSYNIKLSLI